MEYSNAHKIQGGMFIYHKGEEYFKRDDGKCFRIFRSVVETRIRECEESELPPPSEEGRNFIQHKLRRQKMGDAKEEGT